MMCKFSAFSTRSVWFGITFIFSFVAALSAERVSVGALKVSGSPEVEVPQLSQEQLHQLWLQQQMQLQWEQSPKPEYSEQQQQQEEFLPQQQSKEHWDTLLEQSKKHWDTLLEESEQQSDKHEDQKDQQEEPEDQAKPDDDQKKQEQAQTEQEGNLSHPEQQQQEHPPHTLEWNTAHPEEFTAEEEEALMQQGQMAYLPPMPDYESLPPADWVPEDLSTEKPEQLEQPEEQQEGQLEQPDEHQEGQLEQPEKQQEGQLEQPEEQQEGQLEQKGLFPEVFRNLKDHLLERVVNHNKLLMRALESREDSMIKELAEDLRTPESSRTIRIDPREDLYEKRPRTAGVDRLIETPNAGFLDRVQTWLARKKRSASKSQL